MSEGNGKTPHAEALASLAAGRISPEAAAAGGRLAEHLGPNGAGPPALFRDGPLLEALAALELSDRAGFKALLHDHKAGLDGARKDLKEVLQGIQQRNKQAAGGGNGGTAGGGSGERPDGIELFHDPAGRTFAAVPREGGGTETMPLDSRAFSAWLSRGHFRATGSPLTSASLKDRLSLMIAQALFDGPCCEVYCRIAPLPAEKDQLIAGGSILSLCDEARRAVLLTPTGWRITPNAPVRFQAFTGLPLPEPVRGGSLEELRKFVNVDDDGWKLLVAWLVAALRPCGPFPVLCLHGEHGTAKTTTARVLKELIDQARPPIRSEPKDLRDLAVSAGRTWVLVLDNLSKIEPWLSDALCRLSTGGGFGTRTLYSNDEETVFDAQRPVILTGIEDLASRGDLADRALILHLKGIGEEQRQTEEEFYRSFYEARPRILGALLDAACKALMLRPWVRPARLPRMADFAITGEAAGRALGWGEDGFLEVYTGNRAAAVEMTLEGCVFWDALAAIAEAEGGEGFMGTCKELHERLGCQPGGSHGDAAAWSAGWPRSPRKLSNDLRRLAPAMRTAGVCVELDGVKTAKGKRITLSRKLAQLNPGTSSLQSQRSADGTFSDAVDKAVDK